MATPPPAAEGSSARERRGRALAVCGVVISSVLFLVLLREVGSELVGPHGRRLVGLATLVIPMIAVLVGTGYRWFGWVRAVGVAFAVVVIAGVVSIVSVVVATGVAQMPSASVVVVLALAFVVPVASVLVPGLLAVAIVGPDSAPDH